MLNFRRGKSPLLRPSGEIAPILSPMSLAEVEQAVSSIQMWLDDPPGEAVVRQCVVLRLLQAAGFDIWNPAEVVPEETNATGSRADFLIRRGEGKFALEIKGMGVTVGPKEYQQAATYAVNEGSRWAIVTNGRVWVVIDEHLPGKWEDRVALKVEMGQGDSFATDFFSLLNAEVWAANAFADAVETVRLRQQQRRDEARIRREKRPVVEQTQAEFEIATFEKAAEAAVKMGRITEGERDVLLGVDSTLFLESLENPSVGYRSQSSWQTFAVAPSSLRLTYKIKQARASAVWIPGEDEWIVQVGSTALDRLKEYFADDDFLSLMQDRLIAEGAIERCGNGLLIYRKNVSYSSPWMAATSISGRSVNGWKAWRDGANRTVDFYRH